MSCCHIKEFENGNYCVVDPESEKAYIVKPLVSGQLKCQCEGFGKLNLCCHVLVVADEKMCLDKVLKKFKYNASEALHKHKPSYAGEKRSKKPRKGKQNVITRPIERIDSSSLNGRNKSYDEVNLKLKRPFQNCEIWHNDEAFTVVNVVGLKTKYPLRCAQCTCLISQQSACPPFDIAFSHKERYKYPSRDADNKVQWKSTYHKMATKYYCIRRSCVLARHPYFWVGLINTNGVQLGDFHKTLLKDAVDYDTM